MTVTYTTKLGLSKVGLGDAVGTWDQLWSADSDVLEALLTTQYAGDPNGNVAGAWEGQLCYDTTNNVQYVCTTPGNAASTVWVRVVTGVTVPHGGTGLSSTTAYAVLCGGTTSTGALQSIASVGTSGQVLTSNGAGALPTFQAVSAGLSAASQAQMEAATSNSVAATPGTTQYHPGVAKVWVKFDGTGTISITASHNVASLTDRGTGAYTVNLTTNFSSANYSYVAGSGWNEVSLGSAQAVGSFRIDIFNSSGVAQDSSTVFAAAWGDQ